MDYHDLYTTHCTRSSRQLHHFAGLCMVINRWQNMSSGHLVVDMYVHLVPCALAPLHHIIHPFLNIHVKMVGYQSFFDNFYCAKQFKNINLISATKVRINFAIYSPIDNDFGDNQRIVAPLVAIKKTNLMIYPESECHHWYYTEYIRCHSCNHGLSFK